MCAKFTYKGPGASIQHPGKSNKQPRYVFIRGIPTEVTLEEDIEFFSKKASWVQEGVKVPEKIEEKPKLFKKGKAKKKESES